MRISKFKIKKLKNWSNKSETSAPVLKFSQRLCLRSCYFHPRVRPSALRHPFSQHRHSPRLPLISHIVSGSSAISAFSTGGGMVDYRASTGNKKLGLYFAQRIAMAVASLDGSLFIVWMIDQGFFDLWSQPSHLRSSSVLRLLSVSIDT